MNRQGSPGFSCQILPGSLCHLLRKSYQFYLMLIYLPHKKYSAIVSIHLKGKKYYFLSTPEER